jgi:hypothetical protein
LTIDAPDAATGTSPGQPAPGRRTRRLPERATDNGTGPVPAYDRRVPADQLLPDLALYEQLISQGAAAADAQDCPVDHVTARRLAIWLAARPQQPSFAQGLARFINTGAIQHDLKNQLRVHARSGTYADHAQAARLLRYCAARGADLSPVGGNFGAACHQLDRSDLMLADARDRTPHGTTPDPGPARADAAGLPVTALARHDPASGTVTLVLDAATAHIAIAALTTQAQERETYLRDVQFHARHLPEGSYSRRNRQAIADRETRITTRLRAIEHAYQTAIEPDTTPSAPEPAGSLRLSGHAAGREFDQEAEP